MVVVVVVVVVMVVVVTTVVVAAVAAAVQLEIVAKGRPAPEQVASQLNIGGTSDHAPCAGPSAKQRTVYVGRSPPPPPPPALLLLLLLLLPLSSLSSSLM